jgi:hypothetical protein
MLRGCKHRMGVVVDDAGHLAAKGSREDDADTEEGHHGQLHGSISVRGGPSASCAVFRSTKRILGTQASPALRTRT